MNNDIEIFSLSVGDSEMVLVDELRSNPGDVWCERKVIEEMWPATTEERQEHPGSTYSRAKLRDLFKEEGITDRRFSGRPNYVIFKKV